MKRKNIPCVLGVQVQSYEHSKMVEGLFEIKTDKLNFSIPEWKSSNKEIIEKIRNMIIDAIKKVNEENTER